MHARAEEEEPAWVVSQRKHGSVAYVLQKSPLREQIADCVVHSFPVQDPTGHFPSDVQILPPGQALPGVHKLAEEDATGQMPFVGHATPVVGQIVPGLHVMTEEREEELPVGHFPFAGQVTPFGQLGVPGVQEIAEEEEPDPSSVHMLLHPSPSRVLPSSHSSRVEVVLPATCAVKARAAAACGLLQSSGQKTYPSQPPVWPVMGSKYGSHA